MSVDKTVEQEFSALTKMEYPGRFIILGLNDTGSHNVIVYGITGRSTSSQARRIKLDEKSAIFHTDVTDKAQLEKGSPALLIYPAIGISRKGMVVSNGSQTNLLYSTWHRKTIVRPDIAMNEAVEYPSLIHDEKLGMIDQTSYEPDANHTPRICGIISRAPNYPASLLLIKKGDTANFQRDRLLIPISGAAHIDDGIGYMVSTYDGKNVPKGEILSPFSNDYGLKVLLRGTPSEITEKVYEAIGPKEGPGIVQPGDDFRVAVVMVMQHRRTGDFKYYRKNRHEDVSTGDLQ